VKQIAFQEGVSWHRMEFWQMKNILEKMTAVCGIVDLCCGYGRPKTAHTAERPKLKTSH